MNSLVESDPIIIEVEGKVGHTAVVVHYFRAMFDTLIVWLQVCPHSYSSQKTGT